MSPRSFQKTDEQQEICDYQFDPGEVVAINAYTGSGKSTTLRLIAEAHPDTKFLYLCFNNPVAAEARKRFPSNVEVSTMHAYARRRVLDRFQGGNKAKEIGIELRPKEIGDMLKVPPNTAVSVRDALRQFLFSKDKEISVRHVEGGRKGMDKGDIVAKARSLWKQMIDPESAVPLSHDGYLKFFVDGDTTALRHDAILLDEAQDTNPVTAAFVEAQREKGATLILVGDRHQSIYGFRRNENFIQQAMDSGATGFNLTTSFRLTQEAADAASDILNSFKDDPVRITGLQANAPKTGTRAFLSRTNAMLMDEAQYLLESGVKKIHFAGTSEKAGYDPSMAYGFSDILDVYNLWQGFAQSVKSPYFQRFGAYSEIKEFAVTRDGSPVDVELARLVGFVEKRGHDIPDLLAAVQAAACSPAEAEMTLSSIHRSKGMEWDSVRVGDDIMDLNEAEEQRKEMTLAQFNEEVNLVYVAGSRSRGTTVMPEHFTRWRGQLGEAEEEVGIGLTVSTITRENASKVMRHLFTGR
jgi:energy-coupling factor transporter ATP-binding protein EcfA2